tara:strand:+ start:14789 stop:15907 length:1119 start_codon:yes stop_codon:yes gene_type:complete
MAIFKVNINSPVYIKVANTNLADCNLNISIFSGTYQASPDITYQLRKNEVSNNNFVIFEIGELIKDYINYSFSGTFGNNGLNVWVKTVATPRNSSGTALDAITTNMLAFDGVGYFEDGFTTETQTNSATTLSLSAFKGSTTKLMSNDTIFRESQEILKIPVLANLSINSGSDTLTGATTVNFKSGSSTVSSVTVGTAIDTTNTAIEYATSTTATLTSVDIVTGGSTETIKVEEQHCEKFTNLPVTFVNRFGALQRVNFFLKSVESIDIEREEYKANTLTTGATYSVNNHQYKTRNIMGREKIVVNTGYVNDSYNQVIEELLMSPRCWIFKDNQQLPIIPQNKQVTFKTSLNDRLSNYTLEFKFAYDKLNTIR